MIAAGALRRRFSLQARVALSMLLVALAPQLLVFLWSQAERPTPGRLWGAAAAAVDVAPGDLADEAAIGRAAEARGVRLRVDRGEVDLAARVGPLLTRFRSVPPIANRVDAQGSILAILGGDMMLGSDEVVFVDLGKGQGVEPGNTLFVVRRGDAYDAVAKPNEQVGQDDDRFPARALGKVVLVQVGDTMSIGLVTLAIEEMGVGDKVLMRKQ